MKTRRKRLFREGQGVVSEGRLAADGVFHADRVLPKHDENYLPPQAAAALRSAKAQPPRGMPTVATRGEP